jgi:hypothetical protein
MSAFVPPLWSKFGTNLKDLLTKKYDYKHQVTVKNNVASDLTVESTVGVNENSSLNGTVKAKYKNKDFGEIETEVATVPNKDKATLSAEVKATKFYDGLTVTAKGSDGQPLVKVGAEYRHESVATSVSVEHTKDTNQVEATLAAGFDGFSVGGQGKYCASHGVSDYNFGAEYSQADYALTLKTEAKTEKLVGSYWHNVPTSRNKLKTQVGAQVAWNLESGLKTFTVGTEHDIDEVTAIKAKIDTTGALGAVVEHRLANPAMKLNLSANWNVQDKSTAPKQFGVALTFGDY